MIGQVLLVAGAVVGGITAVVLIAKWLLWLFEVALPAIKLVDENSYELASATENRKRLFAETMDLRRELNEKASAKTTDNLWGRLTDVEDALLLKKRGKR